jgi:hypothetical protein
MTPLAKLKCILSAGREPEEERGVGKNWKVGFEPYNYKRDYLLGGVYGAII